MKRNRRKQNKKKRETKSKGDPRMGEGKVPRTNKERKKNFPNNVFEVSILQSETSSWDKAWAKWKGGPTT